MDTLAVGLDDKTFKPTYKARGGRLTEHGVRVWPETLPELGFPDVDALKPGLIKLPKPLKVRVLMVDGKMNKVVGLAK